MSFKTIKIKIMKCGQCKKYYLDDKDITDWVEDSFIRAVGKDKTYIDVTLRGKLEVEQQQGETKVMDE